MKSREPIVPPGQDQWLKLIDILQNELNLHVYPGGYSAMTGWHHRHNAILNPLTEKLYGADVHKIPKELLTDNKWKRKFYLYQSDWFPKNLGINKIKTRSYELKIPSLERALLEMVYDISNRTALGVVFEYFLDLPELKPKKIQKLLERCTSEKVKRFTLFLAEETCSYFYGKIDTSNIILDLKKNLDVTNGNKFPNHVLKYNIEVPSHLDWENCEYESYDRTDQKPARAI